MRTYITMPDDLWRAVSAIAKRNGHTVAAQVRIILASNQDVKKEATK